MLTARRIQRTAAAGAFPRLLHDVLDNGRELPAAVRRRLGERPGVAAAALGIGLQRVAELSFGRCGEADDVANLLLARQQPDGGFGGVAATACATAGLLAHGASGGATLRQAGSGERDWEIEPALLAAASWLASALAAGAADEVDAAVVVWALGSRGVSAGEGTDEGARLTARVQAAARLDAWSAGARRAASDGQACVGRTLELSGARPVAHDARWRSRSARPAQRRRRSAA